MFVRLYEWLAPYLNYFDNKVVELNSNNWDKETGSGIVFVDFSAPWCPACQQYEYVVKDIAKLFDNRVKVGKLNTDTNKSIASKYNVSGIPHTIIFKEGKKVKEWVGSKSLGEVKDIVNRIVLNYGDPC